MININSKVKKLSDISGEPANEIISFFDKFNIDNNFQAYQNLLSDMYECLTKNSLFESLIKDESYNNIVSYLEKLKKSDLTPVARIGSRNNLVTNIGDKPIATCICLYKNKNKIV